MLILAVVTHISHTVASLARKTMKRPVAGCLESWPPLHILCRLNQLSFGVEAIPSTMIFLAWEQGKELAQRTEAENLWRARSLREPSRPQIPRALWLR